MSGQLKIEIIEIFPCEDATESTCPLCGEMLLVSSSAGLLYDGQDLLGCMCGKCLDESPRQVANRLRKHVIDLYKFVGKARHYLSDKSWSDCIDKVHKRAEHWDALLGRLACLQEWPIRDQVKV